MLIMSPINFQRFSKRIEKLWKKIHGELTIFLDLIDCEAKNANQELVHWALFSNGVFACSAISLLFPKANVVRQSRSKSQL